MSNQQSPGAVLGRAKTRRGFMARMGAILAALMQSKTETNEAEVEKEAAEVRGHRFRGSTGAAPGRPSGNKRRDNHIRWRARLGMYR